MPFPPATVEVIVEIEAVGDAEVDGHVLDVLRPVGGLGSEPLHLTGMGVKSEEWERDEVKGR